MPFLGERGLDRVRMKETNNYQQGRKGSKVPLLPGPATKGRDQGKNPTRSGGINRATKGHGAGKADD